MKYISDFNNRVMTLSLTIEHDEFKKVSSNIPKEVVRRYSKYNRVSNTFLFSITLLSDIGNDFNYHLSTIRADLYEYNINVLKKFFLKLLLLITSMLLLIVSSSTKSIEDVFFIIFLIGILSITKTIYEFYKLYKRNIALERFCQYLLILQLKKFNEFGTLKN